MTIVDQALFVGVLLVGRYVMASVVVADKRNSSESLHVVDRNYY